MLIFTKNLKNALRNNLGTLGTSREHDENMLGAHWEQEKNQK